MEAEEPEVRTPSEDTTTTASTVLEDDQDQLVRLEGDPEPLEPCTPDNEEAPVVLVKTACGDYHNLGLDTQGQAYSLPSPLHLASFPGAPALKVTDIACGKEHCMLLTETGQVYSWGGGTRGQLGHGTLASEISPRLIMALDGMKIRKVCLHYIFYYTSLLFK